MPCFRLRGSNEEHPTSAAFTSNLVPFIYFSFNPTLLSQTSPAPEVEPGSVFWSSVPLWLPITALYVRPSPPTVKALGLVWTQLHASLAFFHVKKCVSCFFFSPLFWSFFVFWQHTYERTTDRDKWHLLLVNQSPQPFIPLVCRCALIVASSVWGFLEPRGWFGAGCVYTDFSVAVTSRFPRFDHILWPCCMSRIQRRRRSPQ